jgi:hypothetical protein
LYFSCKSYQELAQARIKKVVGYLPANPAKLVLHFSDVSTIFYAIYKNQPNHKYYLSYPFARRPSARIIVLQCGPWAAGRRGSGQIPAGPAAGPVGEGAGEVH